MVYLTFTCTMDALMKKLRIREVKPLDFPRLLRDGGKNLNRGELFAFEGGSNGITEAVAGKGK